jgi:hypothetical protein
MARREGADRLRQHVEARKKKTKAGKGCNCA